MTRENKYIHVTHEDIDIVATRLYILASRYDTLLSSVIQHTLFKTPQNDEIIELDGTGFLSTELFADPHTAVCSLPDSFGFGAFNINFYTPLAGAFFMVCPKKKIALTTSEMAALIPMSEAAVKEHLKKEREEKKAMRSFDPKYRTLPKGYGLLEKLCVCENAIDEWMRLIGSILDYYIAAIEPLLPRSIVSPTLGGQNARLDIEISKFYRRELSLPFDENEPIIKMTPKEMAVALFDEHYRRYDDFMISIAELRREGLRRMGKEGVVKLSIGKRDAHPSGFDRPSVATKISDIAKNMGYGIDEAAISKMNRYIKKRPEFAVPAYKYGYPNGYYYLNLDHPEAPPFPEDPSNKNGKNKK